MADQRRSSEEGTGAEDDGSDEQDALRGGARARPGESPVRVLPVLEGARNAGSALAAAALAALRERIRDGTYDDPAVVECVAAVLVRRGLVGRPASSP